MSELRMRKGDPPYSSLTPSEGRTSLPYREMLSFINTVSQMIGPESRVLLREIWLDELAWMDCMPEPSSSDWHLVTLAVLRRLAIQLMPMDESQMPSVGI